EKLLHAEPGPETSGRLESIRASVSELIEHLAQEKDALTDRLIGDALLETVTALFAGKVGPSYSTEQLQQIYSEGEARYARNTPPGYMDIKEKEGIERYGDLILWRQLLDYARLQRKPLIFITGDTKEDWWLSNEGKTIGPRPELVQEI